jgi:hypothetical protein
MRASRSTLVAPISGEAQLDLLEIRRSLGELAVRLAARRAEPGQRTAMLELADCEARRVSTATSSPKRAVSERVRRQTDGFSGRGRYIGALEAARAVGRTDSGAFVAELPTVALGVGPAVASFV